MPIKNIAANQQNQIEFSLGYDAELMFCSDDCLLKELDDRSRVVRTGQSSASELTVIINENDLLVPIVATPRLPVHVLGIQNGREKARNNWEKLVGCKQPTLMPVYRVCDCMAKVRILDGEEFEDAATTPAWKKVRGIVGKLPGRDSENQPVPFEKWRAWMAELAQGLNELEKMGLAHGDPYPFNAIRTHSGAAWIDFGHLTDDASQCLKDAWAFVLFTVLHTLRKSAEYSPSLLKGLATALTMAEQPGRFEKIGQVLSTSYQDVVFASDVRTPSLIFAEAVSEQSEKIFQNPNISELLLKSVVQYFSDFLHHIKRGNQYFTGFHFEKQRHHFIEKEMLRLTVPLAEYRDQLEAQRISQQKLIAQKDEQIASLNQAMEAANVHYEHLTKLLASRSWKITRPLRAVARFIKWGKLMDDDRRKLYNYAKGIYHRIPVSYEAKLVFRKYFQKITGWTPDVAIVSGIEGGRTLQISESVAKLSMSFQARTSEKRIPYFGVRRQEGRRRVAILTNQLLDWSDGRPRFGGGERYALELARLLKELLFEVTFYQPSFKAPGDGEYYGFKVVLLRVTDSIGEFQHGLCSEFTELTEDFDHVYYHLPEYASGKVREDGLMTCHGIWFDHNNYPDAIFRTPEWFQQLYSAFSNPRCVVSVDTNSIGVIRSLWPEVAANMRFIPNFYDATSYFPHPDLRNQERLTILFPRRSQINRGSRIFGEIVSLIPHDVQIIWLGEGDPVDTLIVKDVCKKDKRASFAVADFDQMPEWYQKADIAVIPTIACEGTSLSCLEALAAGCAVVSTNVGGLPDLVYDGMNGLLVDPDARSIAAAINRLIIDQELRDRIQKVASETAHHFELKNWRERWVGVLYKYGWVSDRALDAWKDSHGFRGMLKTRYADKWLILTRNAIHGGVESLIREEAKGLNAPVVVCGGHDRRDTCPFEYTRADNPKALEAVVAEHDVILYHWLPEWCLDVLRRSGKRCIEFVHRTDTAESDKTVPVALVTHSAFLARYIYESTGRSCRVVDHPIAIDRFKPKPQKGRFVGAVTSYYDTKGIDVFLRAWAQIKSRFPDYGVRFYGAGDDLPKFRSLANELGLNVDFRDATTEPWEVMKDFACFVAPSRLEGLPVAILEALAMNVPVVASDLPGMVEFNQLAETRGYSRFIHLAKSEDPQEFAAVVSRVLENGVEQDSNAYIRDYYSPEKHCADLVSVYRELCS
ncbi:glycosyltransferase family 4 protein [Nitrosomonas sp.]|uniref:glycosyltransferase family 4 protein n=1 Tax=Nitrosomonas sp. TaxID=42353 RepID=UPI0025E40F7B|nr:glycosyltransferase [Nitrosomonas sp.]